MLTKEYQLIKDEVLKLVESDFSGEITATEFDGVSVKFDGKNAVIGCSSKVQFARGVFLLAQNYKNGAFEITQKQRIEVLYTSLDLSRNGVFTLEALKNWIVSTAALGYTHLALYMEDVYELEGYPRFGYMRGRYTKEDLKKINSMCEDFGVEIIPDIQSLGHMGQYLQWGEANPIKDTAQCLLVDEPKTYEFLEKAFSLMRECFPNSKYLSVSLDEAHDLGTGKFMDLHGYEPRSSIFQRHAAKVFELCKKYNFSPRMAGDMFFRMKSKNHVYYDDSFDLTHEDAKNIPEDMIIGYWDYYHTKKEDYLYYIKQHRNLGHKISASSAVWTWEGYVEDTRFTLETAIPFMQAIIESKVDFVCANTFGDHGSETNFMRSIGLLPIFSEYCYRGLDCTKEDIFAASEFLTKMPFEHRLEIGKIHSEYHDDYKFAKKVMLGDMFYNFVNIPYDYDIAHADVSHAEQKAKEYMELNDRFYDYYRYCYYAAKLTREKLELINKIRPAYENGDKEYLRLAAEVKIPEYINDVRTFINLFKKEWLRDKRSNGIEVVLIRLSGAAEQAQFRQEQLLSYLNGEIDSISELEEKLIEDKHKTWHSRLFSASTWKI